MSTAFEDAWQSGSALDDHFGEGFVITPTLAPTTTTRVDVNAPPSRDLAAGDPLPFIGILRTTPVERFPDSRGHAASDAQQFGAGVDVIEFASFALLPYRPKQRDVITRISDGARYEIASVGDEVFGRVRLKITARRG